MSQRMPIEWLPDRKGFLAANVEVAPGVIVELAPVSEGGDDWGVWGVRIDGVLYREPRDLEPERLHDGPFLAMVQRRAAEATA